VPADCRRRSSPAEAAIRIALFEPDIPQNAGAVMRLGACLGVPVDLIEPAGFVLSDRHLRRAGMDYLDHVTLDRHASWNAFRLARTATGRLILLTTRADTAYIDFAFRADDTLLLGRESAGVPKTVRAACDAAVRIPIAPQLRSLNVATAAAMVLGEALRQTNGFPSRRTGNDRP
jgi:tRNA (cytidine/uridine-2'-O-)-methyltransferase